MVTDNSSLSGKRTRKRISLYFGKGGRSTNIGYTFFMTKEGRSTNRYLPKEIHNYGFIYFVKNVFQILERTGSVSLVTKIKRKCLILNGEK